MLNVGVKTGWWYTADVEQETSQIMRAIFKIQNATEFLTEQDPQQLRQSSRGINAGYYVKRLDLMVDQRRLLYQYAKNVVS